MTSANLVDVGTQGFEEIKRSVFSFPMDLQHAKEMAEALIARHRLHRQWTFVFDNSKVRFGKCDYRRKQISLSRYLAELNDEIEVQDTILHEIAHALAPRGAGHGPAWKAIAIAIGCNGQRCYGRHVRRPSPKHKGTCPSCKRIIYRHRRNAIACARCTNVFDPKYAFVWS
jgi:predicted SprT family Zn-dependent metalloprotease